jgi:hypothetical protein
VLLPFGKEIPGLFLFRNQLISLARHLPVIPAMGTKPLSRLGLLGAILLALPASGCASLAVALVGAGASALTGVTLSHTLEGTATRTFTAPLANVEKATRAALNRMGIKVDATAETEQGKALRAFADNREIEIELERINAQTTRVRTVAKQGLFLRDRATADEIIHQTGTILKLS